MLTAEWFVIALVASNAQTSVPDARYHTEQECTIAANDINMRLKANDDLSNRRPVAICLPVVYK